MSKKTKVELEAELAELQAKCEALAKEAAANRGAAHALPKTEVTLVYMDDCPGYIEVGDVKINASVFGEEFQLSRQQFDALVGKYRKWFTRGTLAVSPEDVAVAAAKGIKTSAEYALNADVLDRLGTMSPADIEKLWNSLDKDKHRRAVVLHFKRKYIENEEPGYRDRARIDMLDRLTDGGFKRERDELYGNYKINPTVM